MNTAKKNNNLKWYLGAGLLLVALVVVLIVVKNNRKYEQEVTTEQVTARTIIETVVANGKIEPALEVKISPYISGEVVELFVSEGNYVYKGDKLAKIDATLYISNFEQVEASLNSAKANMANTKARLAQAEAQFFKAKIDYERNEKLWKQQVISDADWDAIKATYKVNEAEVSAARESLKGTEYQVKNAEAALKESRENLNRTSIYSPNDGTVSRLNVEVGERVTGASQFSAGTEIMRIANLNAMEVKVEVSENDIPRVKLNDTCLIEVDAYLNRKFKGYVTEIATSANNTGVSADQVTNFEVKVMMLKDSYADLINENNKISSPFRPGMSATVDIQTKTVVDVLTVPIQAVTTRDDTSSVKRFGKAKVENDDKAEKEIYIEYVFVVEGNKAMLRKVETGIQDNTYIQVLSGLEAGDEVVTGPYRAVSKTLKNEDAIEKVSEDKLFNKSE
ncbi:MAG: efflux RND transporter periplasmic adaptor subunit [Bacteroidetes bacterium]|nr:efflux RND transporter periplasmic adaptor subunit [Bacteroidota bacterium]MBU1578438.1 efflux RND transporter periplasmic adaptor subunit [Bacteroidota bacterium]MBU2465626.1 efflux RND transporter periplasmic adaptor subunit [Bacteroidota bacterium]MBU2557512.1 efflux RND transporter periplasmic adaptor subunit [Bacteroidota bacterium]